MESFPEADEIRQFKTAHLDAQIAAANQAIEKLDTKPEVKLVEGRDREAWQSYRNLLMRIADARPASKYYRWFNEYSLDDTQK